MEVPPLIRRSLSPHHHQHLISTIPISSAPFLAPGTLIPRISLSLRLPLSPSSASCAATAAISSLVPMTSPKSTSNTSFSSSSYTVILDSGVHVFHFNQSFNLFYISNNFEYYYKVTPGLSSYVDNPKEAAELVMLLLTKAESLILEESCSLTPLRLGLTSFSFFCFFLHS
ncbi:probable apyrase 1 [Prosopis cineraria]|uniref:probable apyrase 1 n=1 Tax=Prosopis cineraria TaxID=364024 RepID=UPI00240F7E52|nr:probable apyrase 1 [Prosopis cineraria]